MRAGFAKILTGVVDLIIMPPYDRRQRMLRHNHLRQRIMFEHRRQFAGMVKMPMCQQHNIRAMHPFSAGQIVGVYLYSLCSSFGSSKYGSMTIVLPLGSTNS